MYFEGNQQIPDWRREVARVSAKRQGTLEPPITEWAVSILYRLFGHEDLRFAQLLTSVFWLASGCLLFLTASRLLPLSGSIAALAYFLFLPLSVMLSLSFQPDALMILGLTGSILTLVMAFENCKSSRLILSAFVAGLTMLVKPVSGFIIVGSFAGLVFAVARNNWRKTLVRMMIYLPLTLLPTAAYWAYLWLGENTSNVDAFTRITATSQWRLSIRPALLLKLYFWREWFLVGVTEIGKASLIAAFAGIPFLPPGYPRGLILGMFVGFFVQGLTFTYHIHTHGYYHATLIPSVAIALGAAISGWNAKVREQVGFPLRLLLSSVIVGICVGTSYFQVMERNQKRLFVSENAAREIGNIVHHSDNVAYVARYYGHPLEYYAELSGLALPREPANRTSRDLELDVRTYLRLLGIRPDYFVITNFDEYLRHYKALGQFLHESCRKIADSSAYLVYDRCQY